MKRDPFKLLKLPKNVLAAIAFGVQLMKRGGLTIMFATARRMGERGEHIVVTPVWLNTALAEKLPGFAEGLPNMEFIFAKIASILRILGAELGFCLSPHKPHPNSLCKTKGGASLEGFGCASSFLHQEQDLLITMLLLLHAFVGKLKLTKTEVTNAKLDTFQRQKQVAELTDENLKGRKVTWHLLIDDYAKAVVLLKEAFADKAVEANGGITINLFDEDAKGDRFFGPLTLSITLRPSTI